MFGIPMIYLRLAGAAIVAGLLWWGIATVTGWRADSQKLEAAETALAQVRADYAELERLRTAQDTITRNVSATYETQLADARKTNAELAGRRPVVRMCYDPASVPATASAATESATAPSDGFQQAAGPDIAPDLYGLALEADECSVRLISLQQWVREQLAVR